MVFIYQVVGQLVEFCAGERHVQMLGAGRVGCNIGRLMFVEVTPEKLDLGLCRSFLQALHGNAVAGEVNSLGPF
jgi:hypothetical protein